MQNSLTRRALTLLAVGAAMTAPRVARAADEDVAIALSSTSLAYGGLMIAEQAGLFPKHGLNPRIIKMDSGNAATSALIGGSVQFCSSGMEEVLAAHAFRTRELLEKAVERRTILAAELRGMWQQCQVLETLRHDEQRTFLVEESRLEQRRQDDLFLLRRRKR